jgi:hypothetical protein
MPHCTPYVRTLIQRAVFSLTLKVMVSEIMWLQNLSAERSELSTEISPLRAFYRTVIRYCTKIPLGDHVSWLSQVIR